MTKEQKSSSRSWFYPLLAATVAALLALFYVVTPDNGANQDLVPTPPVDSSKIEPSEAAQQELNIPLADGHDSAATKGAKTKSVASTTKGGSGGAGEPKVNDVNLDTLGEDASNLEQFTTLEKSGLAELTLDGMYEGEFGFSDQVCKLEADLRISYTKASGKPPRGRWEYLVTCGDQIKVDNSGIEALESHMRLAGGGQWLLTNPSRPRNILEFRIISADAIEFAIYEMADGKYRQNGSGTAYNTESR